MPKQNCNTQLEANVKNVRQILKETIKNHTHQKARLSSNINNLKDEIVDTQQKHQLEVYNLKKEIDMLKHVENSFIYSIYKLFKKERKHVHN